MKKMILGLSLLLSTSAMANTCLQQASNSELMTELSLRLGSRPVNNTSSGDVRVGMSCDAWGDMTVLATDITTGQSTKNNLKTGSAKLCNTLKGLIDAKKNRRRGAIAAVCDAWGDMTKLVVSGAEVSLQKEIIGSTFQCTTLAEDLNK